MKITDHKLQNLRNWGPLGEEAAAEIERLRAALAQQAEPVEQEAALQKIADFGQDQVMTPDVLISKLANLRCMATERHVPAVDLDTIDLAIEHLRYFSVTPSHRAPAQKAEPQEPVAVVRTVGHKGGSFDWFAGLGEECSVGDLLYTAPPAPAAVPLTDEQLYCAWDEAGRPCPLGVFKSIVRAAERTHGIAAAGEKP